MSGISVRSRCRMHILCSGSSIPGICSNMIVSHAVLSSLPLYELTCLYLLPGFSESSARRDHEVAISRVFIRIIAASVYEDCFQGKGYSLRQHV